VAHLWVRAVGGNVQLSAVEAQGQLASVGGAVLFRAFTAATGDELWRTDGTPAGTGMLVEIFPGASGSGLVVQLELLDRVVFTANNGLNGREPWVTDGTAAGTELLVDVVPAFIWSDTVGYAAGSAGNAGEGAFLALKFGTKLFLTDGTPAGTASVSMPVAGEFVPAVGMVERAGWWWFVFAKEEPGGQTHDIWRTNGVTTQQVSQLALPVAGPDGPPLGSSLVRGLAASESRVVALIDSPEHGLEVFDLGQAATLLDDTIPGAQHADAFGLHPPIAEREVALLGGAAHFRQTDPLRGHELYVLPIAGAYVDDLGGRGPGGAELTTPNPKLGQVTNVNVTGAPQAEGGSVGLLLHGAPLAQPHTTLTLPASHAWIDPTLYKLLTVFTGSELQYPLNLPSDPAWIGLERHLQVLSWDVNQMGAVTSNGLRVRVGG